MSEVRDSTGKFAPGNRSGGRAAGVPNKSTKAVKEALQEAFENLGGVEALTAWARDKPDLFYQLGCKMLPMSVKADVSGRAIEAILQEGRLRVARLKNAGE